MAKYSYGHKFEIAEADEFLLSIIGCDNIEELKSYFLDLLTLNEIEEFNRRYLAAKMLYSGSTYDQIVDKLEMSKNTINKINYKIKFGEGGLLKIITQANHEKTQKNRISYWNEEPIEKYLR